MIQRTEKPVVHKLLRACGCLAMLLATLLAGCAQGSAIGRRLRLPSSLKRLAGLDSPLPDPPEVVEPRRPRLLQHAGRPLVPPPPGRQSNEHGLSQSQDPADGTIPTELDFWSALRLGGASSLLIELSRQQVAGPAGLDRGAGPLVPVTADGTWLQPPRRASAKRAW